MAVGNTELCEIVDVEPKSQCRVCLTYWDAGIVYCTCGHLMEDDTTENKKYISSVLDLFSVPNFYIRKGRPHGHRYGKKEGCKEFHAAKQLQRRCRKKHYENIHDRFIRDKFFRKTMIELGRSEEIILEIDRLASEGHSHIATQKEIDVYRGNWWIRSNVVNFDTMPTRRQPDFTKALSTLHRLKKAEDKAHYENWSQSSSSWWQWQTTWWHPYYETSPQRWTEHWSNGETCVLREPTIHLWHESQQEFGAQFIVIISVTVNAVYCHRRGCKENISWYRKSRQKWLRKIIWRQQHLHDQCGQWQQWHDVHQHAQHVGLSTLARCLVFVLLTDTSHPHWLKSSLSLSPSSTCHPCVVVLDSLRPLLLL